MEYLNEVALNHFIKMALAEDIGECDHSTVSTISEKEKIKARLIIKDEGIIAGVNLAERIFLKMSSDLHISIMINDGSYVNKDQVAFEVYGNARAILSAERVVLNCMQRMSGIATKTYTMNQKIAHTHAKILDTRKTAPNSRIIEKWAVLIGGGLNHRFGLFDMILLKDNHIDICGGVAKAMERAITYVKRNNLSLNIVVEARNLFEVEEILKYKNAVHRILLDNMSITELKKAVELARGILKTEASGGINEMNIKEIAETGVDFVSVGALTHSYKSMDLSLKCF
jgi:nicotinate-nucleotide pyrophosphorylase (carboxylating)